ncbi:unnamed protein product [Mycetohabitans rhizoxinica HKI 454]|uniref:Uncharacterized protein n=1 Tax=Mycetohabitans rhizoxinica (strain DSM 19002 / CIP 109453 / HKI 454) TaxID=882378 RepID=E5APS6_MYCRK|nr:unnamed protein product [Mycetohabitans rhizoxinica HKI 454]
MQRVPLACLLYTIKTASMAIETHHACPVRFVLDASLRRPVRHAAGPGLPCRPMRNFRRGGCPMQGVGERCWREMLERDAGERCWREMLERDAGERCWREMLERDAGEGMPERECRRERLLDVDRPM